MRKIGISEYSVKISRPPACKGDGGGMEKV